MYKVLFFFHIFALFSVSSCVTSGSHELIKNFDLNAFQKQVGDPPFPGCGYRSQNQESIKFGISNYISANKVENICSKCKKGKDLYHRAGGDHCSYPENTILSLRALVECGQKQSSTTDKVEFDVYNTSDGQLVVFHDSKMAGHVDETESLGAIAAIEDKYGKKFNKIKIWELTYAEINSLKLKGGYNQSVPSLDEFMYSLKSYGFKGTIMPDIKYIHENNMFNFMQKMSMYKANHDNPMTIHSTTGFGFKGDRWGRLSSTSRTLVCTMGSINKILHKNLTKECQKHM